MKIKLLLFSCLLYISSHSQNTYSFGWWFDSTNQQISIEVGDTVEWTWGPSGSHNLVKLSGPEPGFGNSQLFGPGHVYSHTFTTEGVNTYDCSPHPNSMYGTVTVNPSTASLADDTTFSFSIYPNPAKSYINILINQASRSYTLEIFDMLGRLNISHLFESTTNNMFDVSSLNPGVYTLTISSKNNKYSKKFLKL